MSIETELIQRARYVERASLKAEDLTAEQLARLRARWLHQIAEHDWGIVTGLAVQTDEVRATIQPGIAVDGFGRELVLANPLYLDWDGWSDDGQPGKGSKNLFDLLSSPFDTNYSHFADLWLLWDRCPAGSGQRTRWLEFPRLRVLRVSPESEVQGQPELEPRAPSEEGAGNGTILQGGTADDPLREWPVFLGRVKQARNTNNAFEYTVEPFPARRYARLRGETVTAASRLAQMQLSSGPGGSRFAVALPSSDAPPRTFDTEPFAINEPGDLVTRGDTHLFADEFHFRQGDITVENRPEVLPKEVRSISYVVEKLTSNSDPVLREVWNELPVDVQDTLVKISHGQEEVTWTTRQRIAGAFSEVLRKGLPLDLVLSGQTRLDIRRLPLSMRQGTARRRNLLRRRFAGGNLPGGRAFALRPARATSASETDRTSPQEARDFLKQAIPGFLTESSTDGQSRWGVEFHPLASSPAEAAPWQVYHAVIAQDGRDIHQLRVELAHPGEKGDPRLYRFVVGHWSTNGVFQECLIVQADGTVILLGEQINVNGKVIEGPIQADPRDPRFGAALIQEASRGVSTTTLLTATIMEEGGPWFYRVKNESTRTFTCSPVFENIMKDKVIVRQGPVGGPFTLGSQQYVDIPVNPSGLAGEVTITILVMAADQSNNITKVQASGKITF